VSSASQAQILVDVPQLTTEDPSSEPERESTEPDSTTGLTEATTVVTEVPSDGTTLPGYGSTEQEPSIMRSPVPVPGHLSALSHAIDHLESLLLQDDRVKDPPQIIDVAAGNSDHGQKEHEVIEEVQEAKTPVVQLGNSVEAVPPVIQLLNSAERPIYPKLEESGEQEDSSDQTTTSSPRPENEDVGQEDKGQEEGAGTSAVQVTTEAEEAIITTDKPADPVEFVADEVEETQSQAQ
jgi:hypothetical protein